MIEFMETVTQRPPEGWAIGHVTLKLIDGPRPIEAWRRGAFAVHQLDIGARLSHAPTGMQIWTCETMDMAAELAERIENFADWEAITASIPDGSELYPKVRKIMNELRANAR